MIAHKLQLRDFRVLFCSDFPAPFSAFRLPTSAFPLPNSEFPIPPSHFPILDNPFFIENGKRFVDGLKPGDRVELTYGEALVLAVE